MRKAQRVVSALAGAALLLALVTVGASANGGGQDDLSLRLASGVSRVTVAGPGVAGTPEATACTATDPVWAAPLAGSKWIATGADCQLPAATGLYTYTATFVLPADLSGLGDLKLALSVLVDDTAAVSFNGHALGIAAGRTAPTAFEVTDRSRFSTGTNVLVFAVTNTGGLSGLDFASLVSAGGADDVEAAGHDDGDNHGACVSAAAHDADRGHGENHGAEVSAAAHACD
jgi:hypothetical protein